MNVLFDVGRRLISDDAAEVVVVGAVSELAVVSEVSCCDVASLSFRTFNRGSPGGGVSGFLVVGPGALLRSNS